MNHTRTSKQTNKSRTTNQTSTTRYKQIIKMTTKQNANQAFSELQGSLLYSNKACNADYCHNRAYFHGLLNLIKPTVSQYSYNSVRSPLYCNIVLQ